MKDSFKFIGWAKISAIAAFVSTIIGVAFQKGMLEGMGFGNLSGNYQIEEIISSAIRVYLMIANSVTELSSWKMLLSNIYILVLFIVMGPILWFAHNKAGQIENFRSSAKNYAGKKLRSIGASGRSTTIISTLVGMVMWGATGLFKFVIIFAFAVAFLPIYMSYSFGQKFINGMISNEPCAQMKKETLNADIVRQCAHLTIKGHEVTGRLILERPDAFIFQTNGAFIFISKSGDHCLYSG